MITDLQSTPSGENRLPFVGRDPQLSRLFAAFEVVRMGRTVVAYVSGPSGIGKTALIQRFIDELREAKDVLSLTGRCYARETTPYGALEPLIAGLAEYLAELPMEEAMSLLPPGVRAVGRLFPAFDRVPALQALPSPEQSTPDPSQQRQAASRALRQLLDRLAQRVAVVLIVDDLHWGDVDSGLLLVELLRPPDPPPVLLVGCYSSDAKSSPILRVLLEEKAEDAPSTDVRGIVLGPLTEEEVVRLVCLTVGREDELTLERARLVAAEAGGNPYLASELARHWVGRGTRDTAELSLDWLLGALLAGLSVEARELLETLAVAGRPISMALAQSATGVAEGSAAILKRLRAEHLVRRVGSGPDERVEIYHGRLGEALLSRLSEDRLASLHRRLAAALEEAGSADRQALLDHLLGAGERERAAECAVELARQAAEALAFGQAAELYRRALELDGDGASAPRWRRELGHALVSAGHGSEAARTFLEAAAGREPTEVRELQRLAAEQLLRSGNLDEGLALLTRVLESVGLRLARGPRRAVALLLWRQLRLSRRGLHFEPRPASDVPPETLERIDACWSGAVGLGLIDSISGGELHARGLLLALDAGEPYRVARSMAIQVAYLSSTTPRQRQRARAMTPLASRLAVESGHPHATGLVLLARGMTEFFDGNWPRARHFNQAAEEQLRERCVGATWEMNAARVFGMGAQFYLGEIAAICERVPRLLKEQEDRGDLFASTSLRADVPNIIWLARDDPQRGRHEIDEAMAPWSNEGFHIQHYWRMLAETRIDLYEGEVKQAWERVSSRWKLLRRSLLLRAQIVRIFSVHLRARAALAGARRSSEPWNLLALARRDVRRLKREGRPWVTGLAHLVEAGIVRAQGDDDSAETLLKRAIEELGAGHMDLFKTAAQRRLGELVGGEEGERLVRLANDAMARQRIRQPDKMTDMLAPGVFTGGSD